MARKRDEDDVERRFRSLVNMTPRQLESWLRTEESRSVGQRKDSESVGHAMGRELLRLLRKRRSEIDDEDRGRMRQVAAFIRRRLAQRPQGDITNTRYRYSLMNWGHDPLRTPEQLRQRWLSPRRKAARRARGEAPPQRGAHGRRRAGRMSSGR